MTFRLDKPFKDPCGRFFAISHTNKNAPDLIRSVDFANGRRIKSGRGALCVCEWLLGKQELQNTRRGRARWK